jgi:hypothetical protein
LRAPTIHLEKGIPALLAMFDSSVHPQVAAMPQVRHEFMNTNELMAVQFPDIKWVVPDMSVKAL